MNEPLTPREDIDALELAAREARWWYLYPGDPGYGMPLHQYLGFTYKQWRERLLQDHTWRAA